jgi:FSR family fosmidomycin resistance protein-like MFS transporter
VTLERKPLPLSLRKTVFVVGILTLLIISKYIYLESLRSYYTFYLIEHFKVSISASQICLFVFLFSTAAGTLCGGPIGDRIGRKYVIWLSILGTAPFSLLLPHVDFVWTIVLSFCAGFMLSSAFPAILLYAQELLPNKLGLVSGVFFGFAFGIGGIASAILGYYIDMYGIETIYNIVAWTPLMGIIAVLLPNLKYR